MSNCTNKVSDPLTVLISGGGGSLFPSLCRFIDPCFKVILTDSNPQICKTLTDYDVFTVPSVSSSDFIPAMKKILLSCNVKYYIPLIDEEIPVSTAIASAIPGLKLITPEPGFSELCMQKTKLMEELKNTRISDVFTCSVADFRKTPFFPAFVKPVIARGSRGIRTIHNMKQLDAYFNLEGYSEEQIMVQELLEGVEYTVSVTVNSFNRILGILPKKVLLKKGITIHAVTEKNQDIISICRKLVSTFFPCGSFNVQLMVTEKGIKIFEINPRFSTTTVLTCQAGINEVSLVLNNWENQNASEITDFLEGVNIFRRWENYFYES